MELKYLSNFLTNDESDTFIGDGFDHDQLYNKIQCENCKNELGRIYFSTT